MKDAIRHFLIRFFPNLWRRRLAWIQSEQEKHHWEERTEIVLGCPDNDRLPRVPDAGKIFGDYQVMHNGLKVVTRGYYGSGQMRMLVANRGCHEPQEEVVFEAIVRSLPPGSTMLEIGAYWGFYSMWFSTLIANARVFLVEPTFENLQVGRTDFELNHLQGDFTQAFVSSQPAVDETGARTISIESYCQEKGLQHLEILHSDIQGYELEMLKGAESLLAGRAIDYIFISTHSPQLHEDCTAALKAQGYQILVSINMEETYSHDGLLMACSPIVTPPTFAPPSKRQPPKRS